MMTRQKSTQATLLKLFVVNQEGSYVGEYAVDEECPVGFDDFARAVGNMEIEDMQTVFLGEFRATMLHGEKLSLVAISKGPMGSQELTWAKATLTTVETILTPQQAEKPDEQAQPTHEEAVQDPVLEAAMSKLREEELRIREEASKLEEQRRKLEQDMKSLQEREADLWVKNERMQEQGMQAPTAPNEDGQLRKDLEVKEDRIRELESSINDSNKREERMRMELESIKSELDSAKKDIDARVKILHKKALELLEREETLRKKEEELSQATIA